MSAHGRAPSGLQRVVKALLLAATTLASAGSAAAGTPIERGRYLVESILACGNCHTPKSPAGEPIMERNMAGGLMITAPPFAGTASNITPDRETGIGTWSDAEIRRAIVEGVRPGHGRLPNTQLAVMPVTLFKALLPRDLDAVVAYLRSVRPVRSEAPTPVYRMPVHHDKYPDAEAGFTETMMADPLRRGAYLVTIGHCMECHTPREKGISDYGKRLGAGGRVFDPQLVQGLPKDWPGARAANITSHPTSGLGRWSDAEIKRAITQGISRDGRRLQPPMAFGWYARMTDADIDAIVAYLRTVPPIE